MSEKEDGWWELEEKFVQGGLGGIADCVAESLLGKEIAESGAWTRGTLLTTCAGCAGRAGIDGGEEVADCFLGVDSGVGAAGGTVVGVSFELRNGCTAASPGQALIKTEIRVGQS